eukprot:TRINITY_DN971_c0_g3_i1.p1 TRINITY_DN971_c0_g3~~TRINITY_DN971_c0_g3_i1.p1  ORF type:complete len:215 (+),score=40.07 TRINITY_DN971_c0_g3_i1:24-668(+)
MSCCGGSNTGDRNDFANVNHVPYGDRTREYDLLLKMLLIGDSGVGKSCFLLRYVEGAFTENFISTIGVDFKIKTLVVQGKKIKLQIWDTAGQERFQTITTSYYRGAHGILVLYDVTNRVSFDNVKKWMEDIDRHAPPHVARMLIGNKSDVDQQESKPGPDGRTKFQRQITFEEGKQLAESFKQTPFMETSAKTGKNIVEGFEQLAHNAFLANQS